MLHTLLDKGYAISQIRNAINLAARILDVALANDLVPKNYAALVRKDIPTNPESIGKVLTVEQTVWFLEFALWRYHDDGKPIVERGQKLPLTSYLIELLRELWRTQQAERLQ
jgi:hypothetical protein